MEPEVLEAGGSEELGFFFKRLGEICFSAATAHDFSGPASSLALAARCGAVFFSGPQGLYAFRVSDLLKKIQKWNGDEQLPPTSPGDVVAAVLPLAGPALLFLSPDAALLAACTGGTVHCYSTKQLLEGNTQALAELRLPQAVVQLAWRPSAPAESAALLANGSIHICSLSSGAAPAPLLAAAGMPAACLAWSPDGSRLAVGAGDEVSVYVAPAGAASQGADNWQQAAGMRVVSQEVQDDDQQLEVDTVSWVAEAAILVSSKLLSGGAEEPFAPLCMLTWQGAEPTQEGLQLSEFYASNIAEGASQGPWLRTVTVPQWGATVYSHRKANDDHIKVVALVGGLPMAADVTDDRLAIRIPNAPDDEDNFVVGLGVDCTSMAVPVLHPTDETAPNLPPQPLLLVATSDGVLRCYTFGRMESAEGGPAPCIVAPPQPLPAPPAVAAPAAPVAPAGSGIEGRAAGTALPDEASDFEEEEEEEEGEEGEEEAEEQQQAEETDEAGHHLWVEVRAAGTALPGEESELEEEEDEEEAETPKGTVAPLAAPAPKKQQEQPWAAAGSAAAASSAAKPLFGFAAQPTASAPAFGFGAPAVAGSVPAFGFGTPASSAAAGAASASAPSFGVGAPSSGAFGFGGPSAASSSGFGFGFGSSAATAAAAPFSLAPPAAAPSKAKAAPSQPPMPSLAQAAESQKLLAKAGLAASPPQPAAAAVAVPPRQLAPAAPPAPPAPPKTEVDTPQPKLAAEAREAQAMEADFLRSLHHTRRLEADVHDALAGVLKGAEGPHTAAAFAKLQQRTQQVQQWAAGAAARLEGQRQQLADVSTTAKDALRKCDAMPAFKPAAAAAGDGGAQQLLQRQPLEPALGSLRDDIQRQLRQLRLTADDLQECLMALEERQRQLRSGEGGAPPRLTTQHIYNTVNAQMGIIQAQAVRLEELTAGLEGRGLLDHVDLDVDLGEGNELAGVADDDDDEGGGGGGAFGLNRRLTRLVLTPGSATPGAAGRGQRSPAPHDSTGRRRSPWRLVADSPAAQQRAGSQTPGSQQRRSPLHLASPAAAAAASPGAGGGGPDRWQGIQQQLLQRCQADDGGIRVTTAKQRVPLSALSGASPPAAQPAPAAAPTPTPELPPYSLAAAAKPPTAPQASTASAAAAPAAKLAAAPFGAKPAMFGASPSPTFSGSSFGGPASSAAGIPTATSAAGDAAHAFFLPVAAFEGAKPGYVFKLDGSGLGYYRDRQLPTAGSLFGKPAAPKPKAAPAQPPMPSLAQAAESQKLLAKSGLAPAAKPAASGQPPMPSLAQAAESQKLLAKAGIAAAPKPAAIPKASASQPPMPSLAQAAESQKLLAKAGLAAPAQPPMPSAAAAQAAQARYSAFLASTSAAAAEAGSSPAAAPAAAAAPSAGFLASTSSSTGGSLFGAAASSNPFGSASSTTTTSAAPAAAAAASDAAASLSFGSFGLGSSSSAAAGGQGAPFGKDLSFGAASTAPAAAAAATPASASTPSMFGAAPASGATASAPSFGFGATAAASAPGSIFGAAASSPATPTSVFGAAAPSASSSAFGAFGAAPAASSAAPVASTPFGASAAFGAQSPVAAGSPFGAFGAAASSAAASSPFGQPAAAASTPPAASPFGMPAKPAGSLFGAPATPGFGQPSGDAGFGSATSPSAFGQASGFGVAASQPAFGQTSGFGAAASQPAFGQPSAFGAAAAAGQSAFGQPAGFGAAASQSAFGQPSGFGAAASQPAFGQANAFGAAAAASQSAFGQAGGFGQPSGFGAAAGQSAFGQPAGFGAAQQQGGGFGTFGQPQQQPAGGSSFGAFGQQQQPAGGGGFGAFGGSLAATPPKPAGGAMWQPRK